MMKGQWMEERRAIERLKSGDIGALEALVRRYQTGAVRAAYLLLHDRALAEDVAQEAFLEAYERMGRFEEGRPFAPWFTKMVVNNATDAVSLRERTLSSEVEEVEEFLARLADPGAGPQELAEEAEGRRRVREALEQLPPAQRAAVVQRYYLGMSEAQMAEGESSPPGTIKWRLHAARKRLSRILGPWFFAREAPQVSRQLTRQRPAPARAGFSPDVPEGGADRDRSQV
jgi:RNA polymerase sigma-70 factor (ECF subfamily)